MVGELPRSTEQGAVAADDHCQFRVFCQRREWSTLAEAKQCCALSVGQQRQAALVEQRLQAGKGRLQLPGIVGFGDDGYALELAHVGCLSAYPGN